MRHYLSKKQAQLDLPPPQPIPDKPVPAIIHKEVLNATEKDIIATCLIGEAGGEGVTGMQAVMNVIGNRAQGNPHKFAQECLKPYQFSLFNDATVKKTTKLGDIVAKAKKHPKWKEAQDLVSQAVSKSLEDITGGATHYHTPAVNPSWSNQFQQVSTIGNHMFYKEPPKKKGAWDSTTNSTADPRTVPTMDGGMPVETDKGSVAADEVQPEEFVGPSEKRKVKYRPKEGPQMQVNTEPGNFPDIPYMKAGIKKQASEYDRDYSTMGDTQTSPYNKQNTVPVGSSNLTGTVSNQPDLEGHPIAFKTLPRLPERPELIVVRRKAISQKQLDEVVIEKPNEILPLEQRLQTNVRDNLQSHNVLPTNRELRPALEFGELIAYSPYGSGHVDVLNALAKVKTQGNQMTWSQAYDAVMDESTSEGFYDFSNKIYWERHAQTEQKPGTIPIDIDLPPDVSYNELWNFLENYYPLEYVLQETPTGARIYTDASGAKGLNTLLMHYWGVVQTPPLKD